MTAKPPNSMMLDTEDELAARSAWLHYAGGMTQSAIAKQFGIPTTRAHRLIARAAKEGLVRIFIDAEVASCIALEEQISTHYGLNYCRVAPDIAESTPVPLRALGIAGADFLMKKLASGDCQTIGVGNGNALSSLVNMMAPVNAGNTKFVSLLGGLTRKYAANPYDVIHRLADKTGAEVYMLPVPLFANSVEDKQVLMQQAGLAEIMKMIAEAPLCLVGIGAVDAAGSIAMVNLFDSTRALEDLRTLGARAEILGQFLNADGETISTSYDNRVMAPDLEDLRGREIIGIAGGAAKLNALRAALKSQLLTGLITNEATARGLIDCDE